MMRGRGGQAFVGVVDAHSAWRQLLSCVFVFIFCYIPLPSPTLPARAGTAMGVGGVCGVGMYVAYRNSCGSLGGLTRSVYLRDLGCCRLIALRSEAFTGRVSPLNRRTHINYVRTVGPVLVGITFFLSMGEFGSAAHVFFLEGGCGCFLFRLMGCAPLSGFWCCQEPTIAGNYRYFGCNQAG